MVKKLLLLLAGLILLGLLIESPLFPGLVLLPALMAGGWIFSLSRLGAGAGIPWSSLAGWMAGLIVLAAGTHGLCARLRNGSRPLNAVALGMAPASSGPDRPFRPWSWRWTLALVGGFWLVLLGGMSLIGVVHQVGWMTLSGEPMFVNRYGSKARAASDLRQTAQWVGQAAHSNHWDSIPTRAAYWKQYGDPGRGGILDSARVIFLDGSDGKLEAVVVVGAWAGFSNASNQCILLKPGQSDRFLAAADWPALLALHAQTGTVP